MKYPIHKPLEDAAKIDENTIVASWHGQWWVFYACEIEKRWKALRVALPSDLHAAGIEE